MLAPQQSPEYREYKTVSAAESAPFATKGHGINMSNYAKALIQVVPSGTANPTVEVLWWSEKANKFVQEHTSISKAGVGADVPYEFEVNCNGRIMFVAVTTMASGSATIMVAGFDRPNE